MTPNGYDPSDKMVTSLERIAKDLEKVIFRLSTQNALLSLIAFLILLRTLIGR